MSNEINFNDLQQELLMAEQYLKTNVFRRSKDVSKEGKEEENENTMKATTTSEPVQEFGDTLFYASDLFGEEGSAENSGDPMADTIRFVKDTTSSSQESYDYEAAGSLGVNENTMDDKENINEFMHTSEDNTDMAATLRFVRQPSPSSTFSTNSIPYSAATGRARSSTRNDNAADARRRSSSKGSVERKGQGAGPGKSTPPKSSDAPGGQSASSSGVFKPNVHRNRSTAPAVDRPQKKNSVYKSKEDLLQEADEAFHMMCQFKPKLATVARVVPGPSREEKASKTMEEQQDYVTKMQVAHENKVLSRDKARLKEQDYAQVQCTFAPELCKGSEKIVSDVRKLQQRQSPSPASCPPDVEARGRNFGESGAASPTANNRQAHRFINVPSTSPCPTFQSNVGDAVSNRLYQDATKRASQQQWLQEKIQDVLHEECTFQPMLNPATHQHMDNIDYKPIHQRVSGLQKQKTELIHQLRCSMEDDVAVDCTFTPCIDMKSRALAEKRENHLLGIDDEFAGLGAGSEVSDNVNIASADYSSTWRKFGATTATGSIPGSKGTASKARGSAGATDVGSRLTEEGKRSAQRKHELIMQHQKEEADRMQPPKMCPKSAAIVESDIRSSFSDRLVHNEEKRKVNSIASIKAVEKHTGSDRWFKPNMVRESSAVSAKLVSHKRFMVNGTLEEETEEERLHRMSSGQLRAQEENRKKLELDCYGDITYTPTIDPISKSLGRKTSLTELVTNTKAQLSKERLQRIEDRKLSAECSFKPKINKSVPSSGEKTKYSHSDLAHVGFEDYLSMQHQCPVTGLDSAKHLTSNTQSPSCLINLREPERMGRDIRLYLREKDEKRRLEFASREIEQLQECTFQPNTSVSKTSYIKHHVKNFYSVNQVYEPDDQSTEVESWRQHLPAAAPVIVKGLDRHLEKKQAAIRLKEQQRERENEVFNVQNIQHYRKPEDGSTVVETFNLSERKIRPSRAVLDLAREQDLECSFVPCTNDSVRREQVQRLMQHQPLSLNTFDME